MRSRSEENVLSKAGDEVKHERPRSRLPGRQAWCGERRQRLVRQRSRHQTRSKGSPALTVDQHSNKSINYCSQEQNYILLSMYCRDTTVDCNNQRSIASLLILRQGTDLGETWEESRGDGPVNGHREYGSFNARTVKTLTVWGLQHWWRSPMQGRLPS